MEIGIWSGVRKFTVAACESEMCVFVRQGTRRLRSDDFLRAFLNLQGLQKKKSNCFWAALQIFGETREYLPL